MAEDGTGGFSAQLKPSQAGILQLCNTECKGYSEGITPGVNYTHSP